MELSSESVAQGTTYLTKPSQIAQNYLKTWFAVDFLSVAVCAFDFIGLQSTSAEESDGITRLKGECKGVDLLLSTCF